MKSPREREWPIEWLHSKLVVQLGELLFQVL
jgi:hypothetical protein